MKTAKGRRRSIAQPLGVALSVLALLVPVHAQAVEAYDRIHHRHVEILSLVGGDSLGVGSLLELALEDTREVITGEVIALKRIGHDIELEIFDRASNSHFFIEFPADGVSDIQR